MIIFFRASYWTKFICHGIPLSRWWTPWRWLHCKFNQWHRNNSTFNSNFYIRNLCRMVSHSIYAAGYTNKAVIMSWIAPMLNPSYQWSSHFLTIHSTAMSPIVRLRIVTTRMLEKSNPVNFHWLPIWFYRLTTIHGSLIKHYLCECRVNLLI